MDSNLRKNPKDHPKRWGERLREPFYNGLSFEKRGFPNALRPDVVLSRVSL